MTTVPHKCDDYARLVQLHDWVGVTKHMKGFCQECEVRGMKYQVSKMKDKEVLFPDRLPNWLLPPPPSAEEENEVEETTSEQKRPMKVRKVEGKKDLIIGEENIMKYLEELNEDVNITDNKLEYEVKRYRHLSDEQAHLEVIQMRKRRRARWEKDKEDKEKGNEAASDNEEGEVKEAESGEEKESPTKEKPIVLFHGKPANVPWMPHLAQIFPKTERSVLADEDQKRIVAILKNYISTKAFRFTGNKEDLKIADRKLVEERQQLHEMIVQEFSKNHDPEVPFYARGYMQERWGFKWETVVNLQFKTKPLLQIPWPATGEPVNCPSGPEVSVTLNEGRYEKLKVPNMDVRVPLNTRLIMDKYKVAFSNKCPIEEDEAVAEMCIDMDVPIAMDASTASYLMTNSFLGRPEDNCFAVTVQTKLYKGSVRQLIFISKPKVYGKQRSLAFMRSYAKYAFKAHFVEKRRNDIEEPRTMLTDLGKIQKKEKKPQEAPASGESNDMLGSILSEIDSNNASDQPMGPKTGKRYTVFRFGSYSALIRSSTPLQCDSPKLPLLHNKTVTVQPVIELAPHVGASRLCDEELLFSKCKMIFKQADQHAFVRIGLDYEGKPQQLFQVLQVHPMIFFTDKKSAEYELHMKKILRQRTNRMESLLTHLMTLDNGIYIMREMGDKLAIVEREMDGTGSGFECKKKKKSIFPGLEPKPFEEVFPGIDERELLQWQVYLNRVPGSFLAADCPAAKSLERFQKYGTPGRKWKNKKGANLAPNPESNTQKRKRAWQAKLMEKDRAPGNDDDDDFAMHVEEAEPTSAASE